MIRRKRSFVFTISILIFLLVFFFTWQLKGVQKNSEIRDREKLDRETLEKYYVDQVKQNEKLKLEIESQAETIADFRSQAAQGDDYAAVIDKKLSQAELYAGLTKVSGEGVVVTLNDAVVTEEMRESGLYNNYGIVHDTNIQTFINELKAGGAEALSVNGLRIVAMSEIRCVGPTIMVNGERVAAPFEIKAIGDADSLESALRFPGGAAEDAIKYYGISVTIQKSDKVTIEKYIGSTQLKYAETEEAKEANE